MNIQRSDPAWHLLGALLLDASVFDADDYELLVTAPTDTFTRIMFDSIIRHVAHGEPIDLFSIAESCTRPIVEALVAAQADCPLIAGARDYLNEMWANG